MAPSLLLHLLLALVHCGESLDLSHREWPGDQAEEQSMSTKDSASPREQVTIGGLATSTVVFAVGAVLDFAVTVNPNQQGMS
jgi:hypothetical protein